MLTVAIIGAGPLGRWLALSAARAGFHVLLEDVMPLNLRHAQEYIRQQLGPQHFAEQLRAVNGTDITGCGKPQPERQEVSGHDFSRAENAAKLTGALAPGGITFVSTIEDAVRNADLAIDCVPDELESKLEIFCLLDRMAPPRTVLATPTTRLSIADLASCTYRPSQCIAIVAEASSLSAGASSEILLRTTPQTAPQAVALVQDFWQRLGFTPRFEQ